MENNALIDALPLWGLFIAILGVVLISVECGYQLGKFRLSRREQEKEAPVGTIGRSYAWFTRLHSCVHIWVGIQPIR